MTYHTCPRNCYDTCGLLLQDGKLVGDPKHPFTSGFACGKAALSLMQQNHPDRITHPLVRTKKGFERITLDKALDLAASVVKDRRVYRIDYSGHMGLLSRFFHQRLFRALGTPEVIWDICSTSGDKALLEATGSIWGMDIDAIRESDLLLIWGANVHHSSVHTFRWAREVGNVYVVDPVVTETADVFSHIRVKPAGDVALACQLARELKYLGLDIPLELPDDDYLASVSGVRGDQVRSLAEELVKSEKPFAFIGYGFQRQWNGGMAVRLIASLILALGKGPRYYFDRPYSGVDVDYIRQGHRRLNEHTLSWTRLSVELAGENNGAMFVLNSNPLNTLPGRSKLKEVFLRESNFVVVHELFMTETAQAADLIIPAKHFLEFEDVVPSYGHRFLGFNEKAFEAPPEALSNMELAREISRRLGLSDPDFYESDRALVNGALRLLGIDYDTLKERRIVELPTPAGPQYLKWPSWDEVQQVLSRPPEIGAFMLLTPVAQLRIHSQYANLRSSSFEAEMNPEDCAELGVADGETVVLKKDSTVLTARCRHSSRVPRGVVRLEHGSWGSLDSPGLNDLTSSELQLYGGSQLMWTFVDVERRS
ncbi:molybdopterin-dependent oxidoreductase [Coprothermobacteraceae bacterium]|nr:molybdopterin-dependent oxidoreductase [Coprothermobacteraceae bacterium]